MTQPDAPPPDQPAKLPADQREVTFRDYRIVMRFPSPAQAVILRGLLRTVPEVQRSFQAWDERRKAGQPKPDDEVDTELGPMVNALTRAADRFLSVVEGLVVDPDAFDWIAGKLASGEFQFAALFELWDAMEAEFLSEGEPDNRAGRRAVAKRTRGRAVAAG